MSLVESLGASFSHWLVDIFVVPRVGVGVLEMELKKLSTESFPSINLDTPILFYEFQIKNIITKPPKRMTSA